MCFINSFVITNITSISRWIISELKESNKTVALYHIYLVYVSIEHHLRYILGMILYHEHFSHDHFMHFLYCFVITNITSISRCITSEFKDSNKTEASFSNLSSFCISSTPLGLGGTNKNKSNLLFIIVKNHHWVGDNISLL